MKPHELRVVEEQKALGEKLAALCNFITMTTNFERLEYADQQLLRRQREVMLGYYDILTERIDRFPT